MPNWCENRLQVSGDSKQLDEFIKKAKGKETDLCMNNFFPEPEELTARTAPNNKDPQDMLRKYGAKDWYDWRLKNWGVKWDNGDSVHLTREKKKVAHYDFDSPWSPPDLFIKRVGELYPKLKFVLEYSEPGMVFSGVIIVCKGVVTKDAHRDGEVWPEHQMDEEEEV